MERAGVEPASVACGATILPLNYHPDYGNDSSRKVAIDHKQLLIILTNTCPILCYNYYKIICFRISPPSHRQRLFRFVIELSTLTLPSAISFISLAVPPTSFAASRLLNVMLWRRRSCGMMFQFTSCASITFLLLVHMFDYEIAHQECCGHAEEKS